MSVYWGWKLQNKMNLLLKVLTVEDARIPGKSKNVTMASSDEKSGGLIEIIATRGGITGHCEIFRTLPHQSHNVSTSIDRRRKKKLVVLKKCWDVLQVT